LHLEKILRAAMVRAGIVEHYVHKCRRKGCGHKEQQPDAGRRICPSCQMKLWPVGVARLIRFHDTRHTLGSHAIMSGASLASVQKILRHQDPRLTANTYAHLSAGYLGDELNRITLPGLVSTAARRPSPPTLSETSEPEAAESIDSRDLADGHGAPLVHGLDGVHQGAIGESMIEHEKGSDSLWSRSGSNRRPMHCEWDAVASGGSPPLEQASQTLGNAHPGLGTSSTRLLAVASLPGGHGAPVVHGAGFVHQAIRSAKHEGPGRIAPASHGPSEDVLLTVRQVAERLHLSTGWVYRRIDSGELGHVRVGDNAIRVSAADLDRYLRRFPGIEAPARPAPAQREPSRRRKDGAA
jgi:excisionase family DNA binding protein